MRLETGFTRRRSSEDLHEREIEPRGNAGSEGRAEQEAGYWLSDWVSPEKIERARRYRACEGWSTEWHIYQSLLGRLVETGGEMDQAVRARLRNLVGTLRVAMFPNLRSDEQAQLVELSRATAFDMSALRYQVTPEVVEDIQWIWAMFGLQVPDFQGHVGPAETAITGLLSTSRA